MGARGLGAHPSRPARARARALSAASSAGRLRAASVATAQPKAALESLHSAQRSSKETLSHSRSLGARESLEEGSRRSAPTWHRSNAPRRAMSARESIRAAEGCLSSQSCPVVVERHPSQCDSRCTPVFFASRGALRGRAIFQHDTAQIRTGTRTSTAPARDMPSDYDAESSPMVCFCALAHRPPYSTMSERIVSAAVAHSGGTLVAAVTRAVRPGRAARTIVSMVTPPPARRRKCRRQFGGSGELLPKIAQRRRPKRICRLL